LKQKKYFDNPETNTMI